jgi:hypothetical protein
MELKSFKTYLAEQEQLDEFIAPLLAAAARLVPVALRAGAGVLSRTASSAASAAGRSAASSRAAMRTAGTAVKTKVGNILTRTNKFARTPTGMVTLGGLSQAVAGRAMNGSGANNETQDEALPVDPGMAARGVSDVETIRPQSPAMGTTPRPVDSINPTNRQQVNFSGAITPITLAPYTTNTVQSARTRIPGVPVASQQVSPLRSMVGGLQRMPIAASYDPFSSNKEELTENVKLIRKRVLSLLNKEPHKTEINKMRSEISGE